MWSCLNARGHGFATAQTICPVLDSLELRVVCFSRLGTHKRDLRRIAALGEQASQFAEFPIAPQCCGVVRDLDDESSATRLAVSNARTEADARDRVELRCATRFARLTYGLVDIGFVAICSHVESLS